MATISNSQDILDSRDIEARITELQDEIERLKEEEKPDDNRGDIEELEEELKPLLKLKEEAEGYSEWKYGATLIRDSYFEEYAQDEAESCGYIDRNVKWPYTCIDWEKAAKELQYDYSTVDFDGVEYWVRNC